MYYIFIYKVAWLLKGKFILCDLYQWYNYCCVIFLRQKNPSDASNFDDDFTFQPAQLTPADRQLVLSIDQTNFAGFSFTSDLYSKLHWFIHSII